MTNIIYAERQYHHGTNIIYAFNKHKLVSTISLHKKPKIINEKPEQNETNKNLKITELLHNAKEKKEKRKDHPTLQKVVTNSKMQIMQIT